MSSPAVFIDRDGTLVEARHYPRHPEELVLVPDVGPALATLHRAGFKLILVSNQSGIARGFLTEADLAAMNAFLAAELARSGVRLDGYEHCPHAPEAACDCRKPEAGMLLRAARAHDIDLERSWIVGDILDDIEAGHRVGCRAILIDRGTERLPATPPRSPDLVAPDTATALRSIASEVLDAAA